MHVPDSNMKFRHSTKWALPFEIHTHLVQYRGTSYTTVQEVSMALSNQI